MKWEYKDKNENPLCSQGVYLLESNVLMGTPRWRCLIRSWRWGSIAQKRVSEGFPTISLSLISTIAYFWTYMYFQENEWKTSIFTLVRTLLHSRFKGLFIWFRVLSTWSRHLSPKESCYLRLLLIRQVCLLFSQPLNYPWDMIEGCISCSLRSINPDHSLWLRALLF